MPQPIRKRLSEAGRHITFGPSALFERPKLAMRIAAIVSIWAEIDAHLGMALAAMLKADARTTTAVYLALTGSGARMEALRTAGEMSLPEGMKAEFVTLLKRVRKGAGERNDVVHGLWGVSSDYPEALILEDPRHMVATTANLITYASHSMELTDEQRFEARRAGWMVYTERDLTDIERRSTDVLNAVRGFFMTVYQMPAQEPPGSPAP